MSKKKRFDYDLIVIGSGPAGEKGAASAAYFGKKVALVERKVALGGTMTAEGVPAKTLRETALAISGFQHRGLYGIDLSYQDKVDVQQFMFREREVRSTSINSVAANLEKSGVHRYCGRASFDDEHTVRVESDPGEFVLHGEVVLIATGSSPLRPTMFPFSHPNVYDAATILSMNKLPQRLGVVGGGVAGCEFACLFGALGTRVMMVHTQDVFFPFADREISSLLLENMKELNMELYMRDRVTKVVTSDDRQHIQVLLASGNEFICDALLVTTGRTSNTSDLRLENAGVETGERGVIIVNDSYQTNVPNIYAAGDVVGFPALSSTGMEQARTAISHAFNVRGRKVLDLRKGSTVPYGLWTIPEISMVGETEETLQANGTPYVVGKAYYNQNPRGLLVGERLGLLKLIFRKDGMKLAGVHIIGQDASELIATGTSALVLGATASHFIDLCFNFPSLADMYKYATFDALISFDALSRKTLDAKAMAIKAADFLKTEGPDKAFAAFNVGRDWRDGDIYVFVIDNTGTWRASGARLDLVGKNGLSTPDAGGKFFIKEIVAIKKNGWVDYKYKSSADNKMHDMSSYFVRVGDFLVGAGAWAGAYKY